MEMRGEWVGAGRSLSGGWGGGQPGHPGPLSRQFLAVPADTGQGLSPLFLHTRPGSLWVRSDAHARLCAVCAVSVVSAQALGGTWPPDEAASSATGNGGL